MPGAIEVARLLTRLVVDSSQFSSEMNKSVQTATSWGEKIKSAISTAVVTKGLGLMANAAKGAANSLVQTARASAALPGIANAFNRNAAQFGVSLEAMQRAAGGAVRDFDLMRNANLALTGAGQMLGEEFGKNLPTLLAGARAAAAATGQSVDFLFESLVTGVKRGSPLLIDNTGIVLKMGEANAAMAAKVGKSVEQLTAQEKSVAILNATVEASQRLIEQTGGANLTTAEKVASLGVAIQNFRDQVGVGLNPALGQVTGILLKLVNVILPPLQDILVNRVAPAISVVLDLVDGWVDKFRIAAGATRQFVNFTTDALGNMVPVIEDVGQSGSEKFVQKWSETAEQALRWGIQIATDFASGLVQGATAALTQAMKFIGGLLSSWLAPSSPPKIMPNLDKWAKSSMNMYLHSMTQADFGVLEGMQGPIQTALSRLVDAGKLGQAGSVRAFRGLSEGISKALATGEDPTDLFKRLEKTTGAYGKDIAELAKRQFKLAAATKAVQEAEEALDRARTAQKDAQDTVGKLADEYNKLLAAGASEDVLAAKRAEFAQAEKALDLADDQAMAAEKQKEEADKALEPLQEQVALQQKVLDQMFKMTEPMTAMTDALTSAVGKLAEGLKLPEPEQMFGGGEGLATSLGNVFENAKTAIAGKLSELFAPVREEFTRLKEGPIAEFLAEWQRFTGIVKQFWDEKVQPIIDGAKEMIPPDLIQKMGEWGGKFLVVAGAATLLFGALSLLLSPIVLLPLGIAAIITFGDDAIRMFNDLKSLTYLLGAAIGVWLRRKFDEIAERIKTFKDERIQPLIDGFEAVNEKIKTTIDRLQKLFDKIKQVGQTIKNKLKDILPGSPPPLAVGLEAVGKQMDMLASRQMPALASAMGQMEPMFSFAGAGNQGPGTISYQYNMNLNAREVDQARVLMDWQQFRYLAPR